MGNRSKRAQTAKDTIEICERGNYVNVRGEVVELGQAIESSIAGAKTYSPDELERIRSEVDLKLSLLRCKTEFKVANATTFAMARDMVEKDGDQAVLCLNFASAKNPGGGFLGGSQAQEEALCRASALYPTINPQQEYYKVNRNCGTSLYTHYMIYSPNVPVFRDDDDQLLDQPYHVSVITAPAVNTGAVANSQPEELSQVASVMAERVDHLLSVAVLRGYRRLVLGAWGCGVFRNEPSEIASIFRASLTGRFVQAFDEVHFGVLDFAKDLETYNGFANEFPGEISNAKT